MTTLKKIVLAVSAYALPLAAFAQAEVGNLTDLFITINGIINTIIPFLVGIAVFIIIWGVFTYIAGAGDEEKRAQAKSFILSGVFGVFIMLSIWGLVNILANSINLKKDPLSQDDLPTFDFDFGQDVGPGPGPGPGPGDEQQ